MKKNNDMGNELERLRHELDAIYQRIFDYLQEEQAFTFDDYDNFLADTDRNNVEFYRDDTIHSRKATTQEKMEWYKKEEHLQEFVIWFLDL